MVLRYYNEDGENSLLSSVGLVQFAGASTLSYPTWAWGGETSITGGEFRVLSGASFDTGGIDTTAFFTLAEDATLSGAGSIISPGEIRLAGTVAPTSERYVYGPSETVTTGGHTTGSVIGTLTLVGNVVLDGATLMVDTADGNLSDKLSITGSISSVAEAVNSVYLNSFHTGTYTIMDWTGIGFSDTTAFSLSGMTSSRQVAALSIVDKSLVLTLSGGVLNLTWNGSSGGTWNSGVEANEVWKRADGLETYFINSDSVTFAATGAGSIAVDPGGVTAGVMKVTANGYSFSGGPLTGDSLSLEATVPSSTTFSNVIDFSNGIRIAADNTLAFNCGTNVTNGNVISGTGSLAKSGAGTLTLTGDSFYAGGTTVSAGLINFSNLTNFGAGNVTLNGGGLQWASGTSTDISPRLNVIGAGGATFDTNGNDVSLARGLSGDGALTKLGTGTLTLAGGLNRTAASAADAGDVSVNSGVLAIAGQGNQANAVTIGNGAKLGLSAGGGTALFATSLAFGVTGGLDISGATGSGTLLITTTNGVSGFDPAKVTVAGAGNVDYLSLTAALQNSDRDVEITSALTWNLTNGNQHGTFTLDGEPFALAEALEDKAANGATWNGKDLTKKGAGTLILTADNSYTGDTIIEAGVLQIGNGSSGSLGQGNYGGNIANSGTLIFNQAEAQTVGGVISGNGGLVKQGEGVLTLSNNASDYDGGTTLAEGILRLTSAGATGTGGVAIAAGTSLELVFSGRYGNSISGGGELYADAGPGNRITLSGINDYSGMTTVRSGTLELDSDLVNSNSLTLYSGTEFIRNGHAHPLDSGTLTVWDNAAYDGDLSAQGATMNFIATGPVTGAMLTVSGRANVANSSVHLGTSGTITFADGTRLPLLEAQGGLVGTNTATPGDGSGVIKAGATVRYTIGLAYAGNTMYGIVGGSAAEPGAKAISEGYLGGVILSLQGADLAAEKGLGAARRAARAGMEQGGHGLSPFGAGSLGSLRYNTGSHVDMHSVSAMAGISYGAATPWGDLTAGAFFEYGNGSYDTHNSFSNAASVKGDGHTRYMGGGILGRMDFSDTGPGHIYAEASARTGTLHNSYNSSDLRDASGRKVDYNTSSPYYGLHIGTGYVWNITEKTSLDLYGKYLWTRQEGDSASLSTGESVRFKAVDSHRLRTGGRLAYNVNEYISPYIGASWEHEFDGEARAATNGNRIDAPNLNGSTGIGELGLTLAPAQYLPLFLDLGVQGYVGRREGVTGSLQFRWEF